MRHPAFCILMTFLALATARAGRGGDFDVPAEKIAVTAPGLMVHEHLMRQVREAVQQWTANYEKLKTPEQIAAYQKRMREKCLESIGGLPQRTPLEPQIAGTVSRPGYRVEKIIFQSQPKHYVTALLFLPDPERFKPPYAGVIVPCGHDPNAKGFVEYQSMGALLALNGMAALVFDPIDMGERAQLLDKEGKPVAFGSMGHAMVGVGSVLLGRSCAQFQVWDGIRAIDYLQSRPEVDPRRIGCTGNSGGGMQTSYLMALDDRIGAAAPSCYITSTLRLMETIGPDDAEQNLFGQIAGGPHEADWLLMRAPSPVLVCIASQDFFDVAGSWDSLRYAKRLFTRMGFAERVDILENDAGHNYNAVQREGVARWMSRWLLGKDRPITEPKIELLTEKEFHCTPDGNAMKLPGARSAYDLNEDYENELAGRRAKAWATGDRTTLLDEVRRVAGIRRLAELPKPKVDVIGSVSRPGFCVRKLVIRPETGISLPALLFLPEKPQPGGVVLYVHQQGKAADAGPGGPIEKRVKAGETVLAVDLRGAGQTKSTTKGWNPCEVNDDYLAYMLGRSYMGMQAEDVLNCARYAAEEIAGGGERAVRLVAVGKVGVAALHAATLEPGLFQSVRLSKTLVSWSNVIHSRLNKAAEMYIVHGALAHYDLPELAATLGGRLTIEEPVDALGRVIQRPEKD